MEACPHHAQNRQEKSIRCVEWLPVVGSFFSSLAEEFAEKSRCCIPAQELSEEDADSGGRTAFLVGGQMAAVSVSSVGVRVLDDFDVLPLFDAPPLDGPTTKVGTLARGVPVRAIEKIADFLLLEGDDDDEGNSGPLGWADASCFTPTSFPAFYEFASDLPEGANLVIRASPQPGAAELGKISSYDPVVQATGLQGDYISMVHRDKDDPSSPQLQGWMLLMTDDRVLLTLKPPLLLIPAEGLPENAQFAIRAAPETYAPQLGHVSAMPGSIFESVEQCEGWVKVLMETEKAPAWITTSSTGLHLFQPAQRQTFVMDPKLVSQHGEGVKLAIRNAPSQDGSQLGELTCKGHIQCVGQRGPWLRVLYKGFKEAWMLGRTDAFQLLAPADSNGGSMALSPDMHYAAHMASEPPPPAPLDPANASAAVAFMKTAGPLKIREQADPFSVEMDTTGAGDIVKVLETSDNWVRVAYRGREDGWILVANKRGTNLFPVEGDNAATAAMFNSQEERYAAEASSGLEVPSAADDDDGPLSGAKPSASSLEGEDRPIDIGSKKGSWESPSSKALEEKNKGLGGKRTVESAASGVPGQAKFMEACGPIKVRDEADPFSLELAVTEKGDIVKVLETSGNWVRVAYRGREDGWILVANKRGTNLFPVEGDSAATAAMFNSQEERYSTEAASGLEAPLATDDDDRPLSGAKPAASGLEGGDRPLDNGGGQKGSWEPPSEFPPGHDESPSSEALEKGKGIGGERAVESATSGVSEQAKFMEACGPIKVRDEADPFSLELAVTEKGDIVKVLETSGNWVRVAYRGREDGWILVANKRGTNLFPVESDSTAAAAMFNSQEERYAAEAACALSTTNDDDRPLSGAKPAASGLAGDDRPMDIGGKGSWEPPSEFPPGHNELPSLEAFEMDKGLGREQAVESTASGVPEQAKFMEACGPIKVRDEADPFSLELAVTEKGDIVKVLETSGNWVRVAYRGREDGWILVANKRGTNLSPVESDSAATAAMFNSQEERYAVEAAPGVEAPLAADDDDRPLSGAKPAASSLEGGDRPLDIGGKKGSWEPPSEFPPGHEESPSLEALEMDKGLGEERTVESATSGVPEQTKFMEASGPVKVRDEADPFSLELAVTEKGDIVKVLETSGNWVRVAYRGREDGWILVANKRGTNLFPVESDSTAAAAMFNSQEERYAAEAACAPSAANDDDRPLSGAKPAASALAGEDRPMDIGGKGSWEPPSEFPPGHEESPSLEALEMDKGLGGERAVESATSGVPEQAKFMEASGPIKVRDEADPFSLELAVTEKGDIVKVLETSGNWVRVAYRGREDGWILVANKRGTNLFPVESDSTAAAAMFNSQEERYSAEASCAPSAANDDDRPLSGAKPAASGLEGGDRPLDIGGKKGSWEPPSEFPPGHDNSPSSEALEMGEALGGERAVESTSSGVPEEAKFMEAYGPIKVRDEADPFSLELAVTEKGDIVKVLETSGNWVRVAYRGREDGWILVANKRGTNLFPVESDSTAAAAMFNSQEERYAAEAACAPLAADDDDRPLSGAKPAASGLDADDRPMDIGGQKGSWEPPSEFPPGHNDSPSPEGLEKGKGLSGEQAVESVAMGVSEQANFMRTLGPIKVRDEADPFSLELAVTEKGDIVKVLEKSKQWVRVCYHGREDGWVLTANKRGPMLEHLEDASSAAKDFDAQEAEFAVHADAMAVQPAAADERPLTGANRKTAFAETEEGGPAHFDPMAMETAVARDEADTTSMGLSKQSISQVDSKSTKEGIELDAPGGDRPTAGGSEEGSPTGLHNAHDDGATVPSVKPWQRRPKGSTRHRSTAYESKDVEGADFGGNASAPIEEKPWQKRREAPLSRGGRAVSTSGSGGVDLGDGDESNADGLDVAIVEASSGSEGFGGGSGATVKSIRVQDQSEADGGGDVDGLEASLEERDWKKRVTAYEGAARACRDGGGDTISIVGPILPRMLQDKNVQAVEAAMDVLLAYLPLRSPMGAEEGAALSSALAERALCCGRGQVEDKADEAAKVLLRCDLGEPAGRGAWLTLAARAGGLENEFFPPADNGGVGGNRGRSKAAIAASAPKAVAGCVRAMKATIDGAAAAASGGKAVAGNASVVAGGGESREAVYAAASALLASQKVPIKMTGVSLAKSLFVAEGQKAMDDLRVEDMEPRMKSQVERAFAEATALTVKSSSMSEASPHADVEIESASDPAMDALAVTDVRAITSPMEEGDGDRDSLEEKPSSADRYLSATPKEAVDRANEAAATAGSPVLPKSRTPCRSPCTPARTPHASIPDSTRHFFKPGSARRYTGYRALLAYGARTPFERESQFLAGQMLVLPEGQRSAWDDILDEVLSKGPPATPFRPRRMVSDMSTPLGRLREAQGRRSEGYLSPPPLPLSPPPSQSPAAAPAPAGFQYGVMREARSVIDGGDKLDESGDLLREGTMRHLVARSPRSVGVAEQGSPVTVRAANASLRERIAKLGARNGRLDVDRGLALRGYGSWTSGMDDPTVAVNKELIRADDDDLAAATAATRAVTDVVLAEVRERQRRRASIESGLVANRRQDTTDLAAATRTAADVVFTEVRERRQASNESGALADRPTLAVAHIAEPVVDAVPGVVDSRGSSFRLSEPRRPHVDSWTSSGHADEAVGHYEESASSSTISAESRLGQPRTGSSREIQSRPSELEANETPFETPVGSPEIVHDSDSEYDSLKRTLEKIRLGKYFQKFKANAIMGEDLKYISEGELANIGIPLGARKRLLAEVLGFSSSKRERIHSPPSPASVAPIAQRIPAPAATEGSMRRSGSLSLHSVRARLRQEELQRQRGQEQEQRFETGGGDEGGRRTDGTEDSTKGSLRERSSVRVTSAGSRPVGSSPFFGGRRRDRTTVGGSGAEERRAAMAATELAVAETAEKISGIPARTSGIPRRAPGASRLRAPTARGGRMAGVRGISTSTRSLESAGHSAPVASVEDPSPRPGRQSEIGVRGRSSRTLPAPRARTSFSRRSYQP